MSVQEGRTDINVLLKRPTFLLIAGAVFAVSLIAPKVPGTAGHCTQRRGCQIRSGPGLYLPEPLLFQQVVRPDL